MVHKRRTVPLFRVPCLYLRPLAPGPAGRALSRLAYVMSKVPCLWAGLVPCQCGLSRCALWVLRLRAPPCRLLRRRRPLVLMARTPMPDERHVLADAASADPPLSQPRWRRHHGRSRLTGHLCLGSGTAQPAGVGAPALRA